MNGLRFMLLGFLGLGLWCLALGTAKALEGFKSCDWPVAKGRIVVSRVEQMQTAQKIRVARLCLNLDYLYEVDGTGYEGHRVNVGWSCFGSETRIKELLARYPSGSEVEIRYDPARPERSLLEPGLDWVVFFLWGVGTITISVAWALFKKTK
jgi:hypothetical protein